MRAGNANPWPGAIPAAGGLEAYHTPRGRGSFGRRRPQPKQKSDKVTRTEGAALGDAWADLRRLMAERPLPRGPEDGCVVPFRRNAQEPNSGGSGIGRSFPGLAGGSGDAAERLDPVHLAAQAAAAREIHARLIELAACADAAGLPLLAYLLQCTALEAAKHGEPAE